MKLNGNEMLNCIVCQVPNTLICLGSSDMNISVSKYVQMSKGKGNFLLSKKTTITYDKSYENRFHKYNVIYEDKTIGSILLLTKKN